MEQVKKAIKSQVKLNFFILPSLPNTITKINIRYKNAEKFNFLQNLFQHLICKPI